MAVLVDLNQVMIANLMVQIGNHHNAEVDENMIRHMVLNSIRFNRMKFKDEFGELIICADDKNYWRRQMFPYYKAARRKNREESELDWTAIFNALNKVRQELKDVFPYKVIQIDGAEADDIIGTIIHQEGRELNTGEKFLILSGDKDYIQLHKYANVKQYNPVLKKWVVHSNPEQYLLEHIIKGDAGDGVPNILSPDNSFVMNIRQKPVTKKRLEEWIDINKMSSEVKRNYLRNKSLIDLSQVPESLQQSILEAYSAENTKDRSQLLNFFIKNRLKLLTESLSEF
jgi:5'-3' exonuclease